MAKRVAVLIGNGTFDDSRIPQLKGPPNDVDALAGILGQPDLGNFDPIVRCIDWPTARLRRELADILTHRVGPDDLLLLFYSGHGRLDSRGRLYLATADTEDHLVAGTAFPFTELKDLIDQAETTQVVLLLDCCYSGAVATAFTRGTSSAAEIVSVQLEENPPRGLFLLSSSAAIETSSERESPTHGKVMGVFTQAIVNGIVTGTADSPVDGEITLRDLVAHTRRAVAGQRPKFNAFNADGDPLIALNQRRAAEERERIKREQEERRERSARAVLRLWRQESRISAKLYASTFNDPLPHHLQELVLLLADDPSVTAERFARAWNDQLEAVVPEGASEEHQDETPPVVSAPGERKAQISKPTEPSHVLPEPGPPVFIDVPVAAKPESPSQAALGPQSESAVGDLAGEQGPVRAQESETPTAEEAIRDRLSQEEIASKPLTQIPPRWSPEIVYPKSPLTQEEQRRPAAAEGPAPSRSAVRWSPEIAYSDTGIRLDRLVPRPNDSAVREYKPSPGDPDLGHLKVGVTEASQKASSSDGVLDVLFFGLLGAVEGIWKILGFLAGLALYMFVAWQLLRLVGLDDKLLAWWQSK
jgi:hypothetical protein